VLPDRVNGAIFFNYNKFSIFDLGVVVTVLGVLWLEETLGEEKVNYRTLCLSFERK